MAKGNYLSGLLLLSFICICAGFGGDTLGKSVNQYPKGKESLAGLSGRESFKQTLEVGGLNQLRVKAIYDSQVGVREQKSNAGPAVEKYLRYVNLPKGNPWCAAFVCWVFGEAGVENPRTGWSPGLFPATRVIWDRGRWNPALRLSVPGAMRTAHLPQPSDVFGLYFPEKGRIAHVGFVDKWNVTWLITVEGNTNTSGSREGDGVYRKRRLVHSVYRVARYIN